MTEKSVRRARWAKDLQREEKEKKNNNKAAGPVVVFTILLAKSVEKAGALVLGRPGSLLNIGDNL